MESASILKRIECIGRTPHLGQVQDGVALVGGRSPHLAKNGHPRISAVTWFNENETLSQLDVVTRERDELRTILFKLYTTADFAVGQKRKEPPGAAAARTLDPRKRVRTLSSEENLRAKVVEQERCISDLEGRLSKNKEESKARRISDEVELSSMRDCLKDLLVKAEKSQELIRKLESNLELKEQAALDVRKKATSTAAETINHLKQRVEHLEHDREYLKADVRRYRSKAKDIYMHYKSKEVRRMERDRSLQTAFHTSGL